MLIHGAIIAREYGLPCVTGIPDATIVIQTGDEITVDGYLGIVTLGGAGLGGPGEDRLKENLVMDFEGT
jgi:pyruvate,water dikinase